MQMLMTSIFTLSVQTSLLNFRLIHLTAHSIFPLGYQVGISNISKTQLLFSLQNRPFHSCLQLIKVKLHPTSCISQNSWSILDFFLPLTLYFYSTRKPLKLYHLNISIIHHLHCYHLGPRQISFVF